VDTTDGTAQQQTLYWVNGVDLLKLAQFAMDGIDSGGQLPVGNGSYDRPWALSGNLLTWLALAKHLRSYTNQICYFWICGRFVKKFQGYYMVDAGGDDGSGGVSGRAWDQKIIWDRYRREWKGVDFERGGPSYRNYADYMENIRANSTKGLSEEVWSQHKAEKLKRVLKNDAAYAQKLAQKGDWTTGQVLPVLAATMFLAEPARNIRAFLANKMLLDMMETGTTYGGRKLGSAPKQYVWRTTLLRDPQEKGGKMPAAMAGSASAAFPIAPNASGFGTGTYTQAKELTLLCHYFTFGGFQGTNENLIEKTTHTQLRVTTDPAINRSANFSTPQGILGYLKYLLQESVHSWNA